jgi:hypothetical protein
MRLKHIAWLGLALSVIAAGTRIRASTDQLGAVTPYVIASAHGARSWPLGFVLTPQAREAMTAQNTEVEWLSFDDGTSNQTDDQLSYVIVAESDEMTFPCRLSPHPPDGDFGPGDPYHVELTAERRTNLIGSADTTKPRWVRIARVNWVALGEPRYGQRRAVVAAFRTDEIARARFVVRYRWKFWDPEPGLRERRHSHQELEWGVLRF